MSRADYSKPDYYSRRAKAEGYPARSVYKLKELDERYGILRVGKKVLDLGASPGSWMKYCSEIVGDKGLVVGIDRNELKRAVLENEVFIKGDIYELEPEQIGREYGKFDVVLSDLAPETMGNKSTDAVRSIELSGRAYGFAQVLLRSGGEFLVKVFQGQGFEGLVKSLRKSFSSVKTTKPKSSRASSPEMFIFCSGFGIGKAGRN